MKRVTVRWVDSASTPGWNLLRDGDYGIIECESTGYLVESNRKRVTVAMSVQLPGKTRACDLMSIPRSCVRSIKAVK